MGSDKGALSRIRAKASVTVAIILATLTALVSGVGKKDDWKESIFGESGDRDSIKLILYVFALLFIFTLEKTKTSVSVWRRLKKCKRLRYFAEHERLQIFIMASLVFSPYLLGKILGDPIRVHIYNSIGVGAYQEEFADLRTTLFAIGCPSVNEIGDYISCGNRGNVWLYPTILLRLRSIGVSPDWTEIIGFVFLSIIFATLVALHRNLLPASRLVLLVFVASPGFQLMIERGNLELLVFSSITFAFLFYSKKGFGTIAVFLLLSLASILKFYSIAALTLFFVYCMFSLNSIRSKVAIIIGYILILFVLIPESIQSRSYGVSDLMGTFGLPNLMALISGGRNINEINHAIALPILAILIITCLMVTGTFLRSLSVVDLQIKLPIALVASPLLLTWSITSNYLYRLGLLGILVVALTDLLQRQQSQDKSGDSIGLILILTFASFMSPGFLAIPLNICLLVLNLLGIQILLQVSKSLLGKNGIRFS